MMPVIRIPDPIFERLQAIATPLVDTSASVIERLLDFYDSHQRLSAKISSITSAQAEPSPAEPSPEVTEFAAEAPPDLRYTRVLSAKFDGQTALNRTWNELVHVAHRQALARLGCFDALRSATRSNIANGRRSDKGFHYHPDIGASIQNVGADVAWLNTLNLAQRLQAPVQVEFEWLRVEGAANPGKRASICWAPPESENKGELRGISHAPQDPAGEIKKSEKEEGNMEAAEKKASKSDYKKDLERAAKAATNTEKEINRSVSFLIKSATVPSTYPDGPQLDAWTEESAREYVIAQRKRKGLPT